MTWIDVKRATSVGIALLLASAFRLPAHGQIIDRVLGRDGRTRVEEYPIERSYAVPSQGDRYESRDREGRVTRGTVEYRTDTGTYGERSQVRHMARRGSLLIGSTVRLEGGRTLGRVEDIVIGESGSVDFIVVSVSGLRGLTGRFAVLPYGVGDTDFSRRVVTVNWREDDLRRAPIFFSSTAWPDFSDSHWTTDVFA